MEKKTVIGKIIAPIFMTLTIICILASGVCANSTGTKDVLVELAGTIGDAVSSGSIEMLDEELKAFGATLTGSAMIRHLNSAISIVNDGKLSTFDLSFRTKIFSDFVTLYKNGMNFGFGDDLMSVLIAAQLVCRIVLIAVLITIVYQVIAIVMTIKGGRFWNILSIIVSFGWFTIWWLACLGINSSLNDTYYASVGMGATISLFNFLPFVFSVVALILAIIGNKKEKVNVHITPADNIPEAEKNSQIDGMTKDINPDNYVIRFGDETEIAKEPEKEMEYLNDNSLEGNFVVCPSCGQINDNKATVCSVCGKGI